MKEKELGKVIHYYDKAMVAVVKLTGGGLKMGDSVKFVHNNNEFSQPVSSMEVDYKQIQSAKKDEEVAIKVEQKTHEGACVYKVE